MYRTVALLVAATLATAPVQALADIVPPGYVSARFSIVVTGQIPPGKAVLAANTTTGAEVLAPDTPARVRWHPSLGPIRLALIDATKIDAVDLAKRRHDRASALAIAGRGVPCTEPFDGVRTLPAVAGAREVRFTFAVSVSGDTCTAVQTRTEHLADDGTVVETFPPAAPSAAAPPSALPPDAPADLDAAPEAPAPQGSPAACGRCALGARGDATAGGLLLAGAIVAMGRRRGSSRRVPRD